MENSSLIIVDPQVGFCAANGSLALHYGEHELVEIQRVITSIVEIAPHFRKRHLVYSEYSMAQFTEGDRGHPLAHLCVRNRNDDCEIIEEIMTISFDSVTLKHKQSAFFSTSFISQIDNDISCGIKNFIVAGFLLEHCVSATAKDLSQHLAMVDARAVVCKELTASRLEKYQDGRVANTFAQLKSSGVFITPE